MVVPESLSEESRDASINDINEVLRVFFRVRNLYQGIERWGSRDEPYLVTTRFSNGRRNRSMVAFNVRRFTQKLRRRREGTCRDGWGWFRDAV